MKEKSPYVAGAVSALALLLAGCQLLPFAASARTLGQVASSPLIEARSVNITKAYETWKGWRVSYDLTAQAVEFKGMRSGYGPIPLATGDSVVIPLEVMQDFLQSLSECQVVAGDYHPVIQIDANVRREISVWIDSEQIRLRNDARTPQWGVRVGDDNYVTVTDCPAVALQRLPLEIPD